MQGYCGEKCRALDEDDHAKVCSKSKAKAMQSVRTRRVSRESKFWTATVIDVDILDARRRYDETVLQISKNTMSAKLQPWSV